MASAGLAAAQVRLMLLGRASYTCRQGSHEVVDSDNRECALQAMRGGRREAGLPRECCCHWGRR